MTYPDDVVDELERLERQVGVDPDPEPIELTDKQREHLQAVVRDEEDLDAEEREHLENIREWLEEEEREGVEAPPHETTPAESAWLDLMFDDGYHLRLPEEYFERFPNAPATDRSYQTHE